MNLLSPSFDNNGNLPARYTGRGEDLSPPLQWSGVPVTAKSLALICEDLDAPSNSSTRKFVHWVIYNVPPLDLYLREGIEKNAEVDLPPHFCQGLNSFGKIGYNGPLPPDRNAHRYVFNLYALDIHTLAAPGAELSHIRASIKGHALATAKLTGRFQNANLREVSQ